MKETEVLQQLQVLHQYFERNKPTKEMRDLLNAILDCLTIYKEEEVLRKLQSIRKYVLDKNESTKEISELVREIAILNETLHQ
jgi:hypothetical protein